MRRGGFFGVAILCLVALAIVPAAAQAALLDANCPGPTNGGTTGSLQAQTFTAAHTGAIVRGEMFVDKSAGADFQMHILNAGPAGPAGGALGTTTIPDSSIPNDPAPAPLNPASPIDGTFSPGVPVIAGQEYAIVVTRGGTGFMAKDRGGDPCPGAEFDGAIGGAWTLKDPGHDYPFSVFVEPPEPSNQFSIKSQLGRTITVTVPGPGTLSLGQAPLPPGQGTVARGFNVLLPSSGQASGAGDVTLPILLNKSGKRQLIRRGRLGRTAEITYTPEGGTANSLQTPIKLRRKHHHRHHR